MNLFKDTYCNFYLNILSSSLFTIIDSFCKKKCSSPKISKTYGKFLAKFNGKEKFQFAFFLLSNLTFRLQSGSLRGSYQANIV